MTNDEKIPFWRDDRFLKILVQVVIVFIVVTIFVIAGNNLARNFRRRGLDFSLAFLLDANRPASFKIGDSLIPYSPTDPYFRALLVGLLNSLRVMVSGIILAAILGITVGIGRLSDNWLVRKIAAVYVETFRNTPLLLQLFFWYFAIFLRLPKIDNPLVVWDSIFLTNRGMQIPFPSGNLQTWLSLGFLVLSAILAVIIWRKQTQAIVSQGSSGRAFQVGSIGIAIAAIFTLIFGLDWQQPQFDRATNSIEGGLSLSSEFAALTFGLTVYTAAFIAEVVRAGIQSVGKGQWEAARALGLKPSLIMRLVIFPQALRVMIPPLTSEFLNLAKNSSLAIAVLYSDIYAISYTISNQTGNAVEMLLVVMATYLILNLMIASLMNWFNRSVQIKER
ncbi:amino acid ABC transporter permease [Hydrococcus rivularis NIES-593]|uniref:Amino acid ABC transporter permease n=1 Tax=Hydrococcus rivularis NIES-593 TaxID=1921803 RepID=A0A1U7HFN2_9CYAN|nr:ABC transporter permease subunit [Hydrococcus rivularis]OKH22412.1 amino acid ABC transporter permease [Hydrococcus rivularis NIES-593]